LADVTLNGTLSGTGTLTIASQGTGNLLTLNSTAGLSGFSGLAAGVISASSAVIDFGSYSLFTLGGAYTQTGGTITVPSGADFNTFTLNSGSTFNAPVGNAYFGATFTINAGATFNANGGTVTFDGSTATLICNNVTFNQVNFTHIAAGIKTVSSDCNLPLGSNPSISGRITLNGTLSGSDTITFAGANLNTLNTGASLTGFDGIISTGPLTVSGATMDLSSYTTAVLNGSYTQNGGTMTAPSGVDFNSVFTLSSGAVFNAPAGDMAVAGHFTVNAGTTFNTNGGTLTLDGSTATIICDTTSFNLVKILHAVGTKTVGSDCDLPLGNNPTVGSDLAKVNVNGTLSGSGKISFPSGTNHANSTNPFSGFTGFNSGGSWEFDGGTVDFSDYNTVDFDYSFRVQGADVTAPSSVMSVGDEFVVSSGTFSHNNGTVIMDGSDQEIQGTTFYNLTKTCATACTLTMPAGSTETVLGKLTLKGAPGQLLSLVSSTPGSEWYLDSQGTYELCYLSVTDSNNIGNLVTAYNSTSNTTNTGWAFSSGDCVSSPSTTTSTSLAETGQNLTQTIIAFVVLIIVTSTGVVHLVKGKYNA